MSSKIHVSSNPDTDRRRSQRVMIAVPIIVASASSRHIGTDGKTIPAFEEETSTLVVNAHGALITLAARVEKGETLRLTSRPTQTEHLCKIIYVGPESGGKAQVGVEFTTPNPEFWGIVFPPDDWGAPTLAKSPEAAKTR